MRRMLLVFALCAFLAPAALAAGLTHGELLVTGSSAAGTYVAAVSPVTGVVRVLSTGGLITSPWVVAQGNDGFVYVGNSGNIIRVNPDTGAQSLFSTNLSPAGMGGFSSMIRHSNGSFYYSGLGRVVKVNAGTGAQTPVTPASVGAYGIVEGPDHQVWAATEIVVDPTHTIAVLRVDLATGSATPVASGIIGKPRSLAFDTRDSLYVEAFNNRVVHRIDYVAGTLSWFTGVDNSYSMQGMVGHPNGLLYFTHNAGTAMPRVDRLDPLTGVKSILTQGGLLGQSVVAIKRPRFPSCLHASSGPTSPAK